MVEKEEEEEKLRGFLKSGIYQLEANIMFMDPVRVLNHSYTQFSVSPSTYYSRSFLQQRQNCSTSRKRKRKKLYLLNQREQSADVRHNVARPLLLKAHEALLRASNNLFSFLTAKQSSSQLQTQTQTQTQDHSLFGASAAAGTGENPPPPLPLPLPPSLIHLGTLWQAPLYEISLYFHSEQHDPIDDGGTPPGEPVVAPIFNNLLVNHTCHDAKAKFLDACYILPPNTSFYMSSLEQIRDLIPAKPDTGFNLIVIDPPWENRSARQKSLYPTLPNRYFLSLPIKELAHTEGALVALWVTNREKLRVFVEKELFPSWDVTFKAVIYWLKVKTDGSLIGDLDLFHHRPYECLLVGFAHGKGVDPELSNPKPLPENQVIISVPGDYSRKPPIGELLLDYAPGPKSVRCIELFARELLSGWTSWGNEPLHFQESRYFLGGRVE